MATLTHQLTASHRYLDALPVGREAMDRLRVLAADPSFVNRVIAKDPEAMGLHDLLRHRAEHGDVPWCCEMPEPRTAADVRRDAELKYDSAIPQEVLDAIAEQEKRERA